MRAVRCAGVSLVVASAAEDGQQERWMPQHNSAGAMLVPALLECSCSVVAFTLKRLAGIWLAAELG